MNLDTKITEELLTVLGFFPGKWHGGTIADHLPFYLDLGEGRKFRIFENEKHDGGSYGGYEVEPYPGGFSVSTIAELLEEFKKQCTPDETAAFMTRLNALP